MHDVSASCGVCVARAAAAARSSRARLGVDALAQRGAGRHAAVLRVEHCSNLRRRRSISRAHGIRFRGHERRIRAATGLRGCEKRAARRARAGCAAGCALVRGRGSGRSRRRHLPRAARARTASDVSSGYANRSFTCTLSLQACGARVSARRGALRCIAKCWRNQRGARACGRGCHTAATSASCAPLRGPGGRVAEALHTPCFCAKGARGFEALPRKQRTQTRVADVEAGCSSASAPRSVTLRVTAARVLRVRAPPVRPRSAPPARAARRRPVRRAAPAAPQLLGHGACRARAPVARSSAERIRCRSHCGFAGCFALHGAARRLGCARARRGAPRRGHPARPAAACAARGACATRAALCPASLCASRPFLAGRDQQHCRARSNL